MRLVSHHLERAHQPLYSVYDACSTASLYTTGSASLGM